MRHNEIKIACPCCKAELTVDRETGDLIRHEPHREEKRIPAMEEMLKRLSREKEAIEEKFQKESRALKDRSKVLEEKFKESMEKVDRSDTRRPIRPIDLD